MRAREYIAQLREKGRPYALDSVFDRGKGYQREGSLADAHLLFFFSAREGYLPAMMKMGEMADPILFQAQESLLDYADGIQAYKWYRKASAQGHPVADKRPLIDGQLIFSLARVSDKLPVDKGTLEQRRDIELDEDNLLDSDERIRRAEESIDRALINQLIFSLKRL